MFLKCHIMELFVLLIIELLFHLVKLYIILDVGLNQIVYDLVNLLEIKYLFHQVNGYINIYVHPYIM